MVSNLEIRVNINKLIEYSESLQSSVDRKTMIKMIRSFSQYLSGLYVRMIIESINSNRYKGNWEPREDKGYQEYLGVKPEIDITTLISDSMEVKKIGYNFIIRVNPRYKYPGSKLTLVKVLRAIDNGTSRFHARPIFKRILKDIDSNILRLWKGYLLRKGVL